MEICPLIMIKYPPYLFLWGQLLQPLTANESLAFANSILANFCWN